MEKELEKSLEKITSHPGVIGVVAADKSGLCLGASGVGCPEQSGLISHLVEVAKKLEPSREESKITIKLEAEAGYCLIQKQPEFTLAVFKK